MADHGRGAARMGRPAPLGWRPAVFWLQMGLVVGKSTKRYKAWLKVDIVFVADYVTIYQAS